MRMRVFGLMTVLVVMISLFPTTAAFADSEDGNYELKGIVGSMPASGFVGQWTVNGSPVNVSAATRIDQEHGPMTVGACVEVKGWLQTGGAVDATKVETKELYKCGAGGGHDDGDHGGGGHDSYTDFYGSIEQLPSDGYVGTWQVSGRTVNVSSATRIKQEHGPVAMGAYVEVKGWSQAGAPINATKIEVKSVPGGGDHDGGGRAGYAKFYGTVEQLPSGGYVGTWRVSGRTVSVSAATRIKQEHGAVAVGAYVEVKGWSRADGSVNATKIEVKSAPGGGGSGDDSGGGGRGAYARFYGTVEQMPTGGSVGIWQVNGRTVNVSATTRIEQEHGAVAVGAYVKVEGFLQADGSINATKIEVKRGGGDNGGGSSGYVKFYGVVESLPAAGLIGDWSVSGRTMHVRATTRIEQEHGAAQVGANVEVKGIQQADGTINAFKIEVKR